MDKVEQAFIDEFLEFLNAFQDEHECLIESVKLENDAVEANIFERKIARMS